MTRRIFALTGLWSALAFALNLLWEIAQVRLYTIWDAADRMTVAWALLHCTLGDVVIALALFALAGVLLRCADDFRYRPCPPVAVVDFAASDGRRVSKARIGVVFRQGRFSTWLTLAVIPAIYALVKQWRLNRGIEQ